MKERIRELLRTVPFQAFVICMADGRKFQVNHPDFVFAPPTNQSYVSVAEENEDRLHHLSALLMTGVEYAPSVEIAS